MRKLSRIRGGAVAAGAVAVAAALTVGVGVSSADVSPLADEQRSITTLGGWRAEAALRDMTVTPVPNLAVANTTREGFISVLAAGQVQRGGTGALHGAEVELSIDIGCGLDVSNGVTVGLQGSVGASANVNIGPVSGFSPGLNASVGPSVSTQLKPGAISTVSLGKKQLEQPTNPGDPFLGGVRVAELPIKVNNCLGPVSTRLVSKLTVSTTVSNEVVYAYSKPMWL
ncbi:MspA protein [Rhodococcus sp. OK611]|uniref:MspA family porin n=1 Tax=unclassified Rhodococcus (in: high G+C Gram-positive bacteria) TaxID=192944 RepID=UPI000BC708C0|nr:MULTISPECIES: MspA family porin [unclassified Rhodococcus (in: high G+C Gram-positive bacteria)]PTR43163.1 MspA protein [Rhodococcus sp. OK611]SNX91027.1 MspA protein [Rhodococcus sp. OK270]